MRYAVFAVTAGGAELAMRTAATLDGETVLFLKQGTFSREPHGLKICAFERLRDAAGSAFSVFDGLIFIMAAGIAVRMIAPHVESKLSDPAVLVMDERGIHVISLLSGHIGGANALARQLGHALGAEPVITTATDVEQKLAVDVVAAELALRPVPRDAIKSFNGQILSGGVVNYYVDAGLPNGDFYCKAMDARGLHPVMADLASILREKTPKAVVTDAGGERQEGMLLLVPRRLAAGVGCRRGTPKEQVLQALQAACARIGRSAEDISLLCSTVAKRDEPGLLQAAHALGRQIVFHENEALQAVIAKYGLRESGFVKEHIGVGNVCEAAALASVERGRMAVGKTKFGKVTVALVWER